MTQIPEIRTPVEKLTGAKTFRALGLSPILLNDAMLGETLKIVERFKERYDPSVVAARSLWTRENRPGVLPVASGNHPA